MRYPAILLFTSALLLVCGIGLTAGHASATSVEPMDLPELAQRSSGIVHGTVVGAASRWNDDRSLILTDVRVRVDDAVKGSASGEILVTQPGGVIGKLKVEVPGAAAFRIGEEVILFLAPDPSGRLFVNGLDHGRYRVQRDPETGVARVEGLSTESLQMLRSAGAEIVAGDVSTGTLDLNRFLDGMRRMVRDLPRREGN